MAREKFDGGVAIVTGAASGIGREIAVQLAAHGAVVVMVDVNADGLQAAAGQITASGGIAEAVPTDVSDREAMRALVAGAVERHGKLDYMFNNAGVAILGDIEASSLDEWDKIIDVNIRGVAYGVALAYEQMLKQGGGHIVNTASLAGLLPVGLQVQYCTTKHAVVGMSKTLRLEARSHGVNVTAFCPAWVESGMFDTSTLHGDLEGVDAREEVPMKIVPTERAVKRLLAGVAANKAIVLVPGYARGAWLLERFSPALAERVHRFLLREMRRRARKPARGRGTAD